MQANLTIENGCNAGKRKWLSRGERILVGASPHADFGFDEPELNHTHLSICLDESGCNVFAAGDSSFIHNDAPQRQMAILGDGDFIQIGTTVIRIELEGSGQDLNANGQGSGMPSIVEPPAPFVAKRNDEFIVSDHDDDFSCIVSKDKVVTANGIATTIQEKDYTVFLLCRFDRWSFPVPEELADAECVPKAKSSSDVPYLTRFFDCKDLTAPAEILEKGFLAPDMMGIVSNRSAEEILSYVRKTGGLFLSPAAMHAVAKESQEGALAAILGPIDALLLGTYEDWELYVRKSLLPILELPTEPRSPAD